jgi:aminopeptidase YwaD
VAVEGVTVPVVPSPYGIGVDGRGPIRVVGTRAELNDPDLEGSVLVVKGDLVEGPLTPKKYPFYDSEEHAAIIDALETRPPTAIVAVTGKHPALCGALDPYPWIEDGDFTIPAASVSPASADPLLAHVGQDAQVSIEARRIDSSARNVVARRGPQGRRITVCAHIDAKPGTPGAVDNAAGVAVLVALAERLADAELPLGVELLAVNGEDHFAAGGELDWLAANEGRLDDIVLFANIDGAGYRGGDTAFSLYNFDSEPLRSSLQAAGLVEGPPWYQSDHAMVAMQGRPALAFTTEAIEELLEGLFHAPDDTPDQVDGRLLTQLADALTTMILSGHL